MKKSIYFVQVLVLFAALISSALTVRAQTLQTAGSVSATGGITQFYFDAVDNALYACGTVSKADGKDIDQIMYWDGSGWMTKGNISNLITMSYPAVGTISRANDTLFVLGAMQSVTYLVELAYWDGADWTGTGYGLSFNNDRRKLIEYNNSLFLIGAQSGMRLDSVNYSNLGNVAVWNGFEFVSANYPSLCQKTSGALFNGKLYVGDYAWDGNTWETYGLDVNNCSNEVQSMTVYNNQLVIAMFNDSSTVQTFDGTNFTTILSGLDRRITDMVSLGDKLAITGNFNTVDGKEIKEVALWDGTEWSGISGFGGNSGTIGNYHGQLLISSPEGYPIFDYTDLNNPIALGSIAKYGDPSTGVNDKNEGIPTKFGLSQNYPNPFNPTTTIKYSIPTIVNDNLSFVQIKVFDTIGRETAVLVNETKTPGNYYVTFDAGNLTSGIYFYKLTAGSTSIVKKMILLK